MKLLLSILVLASLCAPSSWSVSSGSFVVTQPANVSVMEGGTVNITCCWRGTAERISVSWLKNPTDIKSEIEVKNHSVKMETRDCSNLTISNITQEDSGTYICRVTGEIPRYFLVNGSGTFVTVTAGNNMKDKTGKDAGEPSRLSGPVIAAAAAVVPLLLITVFCYCILRRKQAQAARVIYEAPHIDSEVADMDKHSTSSSRGSSQWCQVPVYESLDYFEHLPSKESG